MNVLIIGNGFDLAHGLPTKYEHFLKFANAHISGEIKNLHRSLSNYFYKTLTDKEKTINIDLDELITDNIWIEYFNKVYELRNEEGKDGWIDFENEISKLIQELDEIHHEISNDIKEIRPHLFHKYKKMLIGAPQTLDECTKVKSELLYDLNRLTRALEIYLSDYVNNLPVECSLPDINNLKIDKVLSFNYTNTFERIYGKSNPNIEYDYIHGKAEIGHDINSCKLVLGIDEYLTGEERDKNIEFIQFKKFYQRIYKGTGSKYIDWLKNSKEDLNIYIFGHSLDITDKDILRRFILHDMNQQCAFKTRTTIFHFNQEALGKQIVNLVKVIGQDNLISMTSGSDAKIILKQQTDDKFS